MPDKPNTLRDIAKELLVQLKQAYDEQGSLNDGMVLSISQQLDEVVLEIQRQKMKL